MAKRQSVDDLYRDRSFPRGQVREQHPLPPRDSDYGRHEEVQKNQAPEDRHAPNYNNDCQNDWLRGGGENATGKPGYDKGSSWRLKDKGNDWNSGHDEARIRKPEKNVP
jgi:hypothetical protein